jgi:hypothetical protein
MKKSIYLIVVVYLLACQNDEQIVTEKKKNTVSEQELVNRWQASFPYKPSGSLNLTKIKVGDLVRR